MQGMILFFFGLQPFDMGCQSVQAGEQGKAVHAVNVERPPELGLYLGRDDYPVHVPRVERLVGIGMDGEQPALGGDARRQVAGDELTHLPVLERVIIQETEPSKRKRRRGI